MIIVVCLERLEKYFMILTTAASKIVGWNLGISLCLFHDCKPNKPKALSGESRLVQLRNNQIQEFGKTFTEFESRKR